MYCPNCKKEYEFKFCPECGTKLIEMPAKSGYSLNIGDANAISGGINFHDSHNVTNVDNSVHSITNITEIKSGYEISQQIRSQYFQACESMLSDGILTLDELRELETLRIHLNISKDEADRIFELVRSEKVKKTKTKDLDIISKIKFQKFTKMISSNDLEGLKTQIDAMVALAATNNNEDLHYYCYLVLSTIGPSKMVEILNSSLVDNYWESFWSYVAYLKKRDYSAAEKMFIDLSRFKEYPESNLALLGCMGELLKGDEDSALMYYEGLSDDCSVQLQSIYSCVRYIFGSVLSVDDQKSIDFYLIHLFERSVSTYVEAIPFIYDGACDFIDGLGAVQKNGKVGYIDKSGNVVASCQYDDIDLFSDGLAAFEKNDKWGYIDKTGREVIPCKYDGVDNFCEGLARVEKNDKWGYIDKTGREVIPCKYDDVDNFCEGLARVEKNDKCGYIDKTGREVIPCKYDGANSFSGNGAKGLAVVSRNGKVGYIDKFGREIIPCKYDEIGDFSDGLAQVKEGYKWGFVDESGRVVIPCQYFAAGAFSEGLAPVRKIGKQMYIYKTGLEAFSCEYYMCGKFSNGIACVEKNGKRGYIDMTGREIVPCKYNPDEKFIFFSEECVLAIDCNGDTYIYSATNGQNKKTFYNYTEIIHGFKEGLACVKRGGKLGFIDKNGREVISCRFDEDGADYFHEGYAAVKLNGKWGYLKNTEYCDRAKDAEEAQCKATTEENTDFEIIDSEKTGQDQESFFDNSFDTPEIIVDGIIANMVGGFENVHVFGKNDKYKVCKYLVTQHEWEIIMGSNPSWQKSPNYPVVNITYAEAEEFVKRVNKIAQGKGYLFMIPPTTWQWLGYQEKCAKEIKYLNKESLRAGVSAFAWNEDNSEGHLHNVGKLKPTAGIYDAVGLVYEIGQTKKYNSYSYGAFNESIDHCFGKKSSELMYVDKRYDNLGIRLICHE